MSSVRTINLILADAELAKRESAKFKGAPSEETWNKFLEDFRSKNGRDPSFWEFNEFCDKNGYLTEKKEPLYPREFSAGFRVEVEEKQDDGSMRKLSDDEVLDLIESGEINPFAGLMYSTVSFEILKK